MPRSLLALPRLRSTFMALLAMAISGCMAGPWRESVQASQTRSDQQGASAIQTTSFQAQAAPPNESTVQVERVVTFGEPRVVGGPEKITSPAAVVPLSLDEVINLCLVADPKLRAGFESINQANADALTASLVPNPQLGVGQTLLPLGRPFTVDRQGGPPQLDVGVSYPIDWFLFGKRAAALVSAQQGVRISEAEYADLVRRRVTEAAVAYYDVVEAKALLELARANLKMLTEMEARTKKAVDAQGRALVDLNRIRLEALKGQQSLREAESAVAIARAKLRALIGRADSDPMFDVQNPLDAKMETLPMPTEAAFALAEESRPDIQALRLRIAKAQADSLVEYRNAFPDVTPKVGYTRQFQEKAIGFPDANAWGAGLDMSLPIYNRNQGNRLKAQSVEVQSRFELETGMVELRADIEQAVKEFDTAFRSAGAVADQRKIASDVRDTIQKSFDAGGRTPLEVLDAQRNYQEVERLSVTSRANYWRAFHRLNAAVGKQIGR